MRIDAAAKAAITRHAHRAPTHHHVRRAARWLTRHLLDRFLLLPIGAVIALVWANSAAESYFTFAAGAVVRGQRDRHGVLLRAVDAGDRRGGDAGRGPAHLAALGAAGGRGRRRDRRVGRRLPAYVALSVRGRADDGMADRLRHRHRRGVLPAEGDHAAQRRSSLCTGRRDRHRHVWHPRRRAALPDARDSRQRRGAPVAGDRARRLLRAIGVRAFWPYLSICGTISWLAFFWAGLHPAFALVPIVPFLPHEPRRLDLFADPPDDDAIHHFEHEWTCARAGHPVYLRPRQCRRQLLRGYDTGSCAMLAAALVGRPLGILAAVGRRCWRSAPATASRLARAGGRRAGDFERFHDRVVLRDRGGRDRTSARPSHDRCAGDRGRRASRARCRPAASRRPIWS